MKKIMKLFPAALALVALASCSTDDLFDNGKQKTAENELKVNVEQFDNLNATRAVREWKGTVLNFQEGDRIRVYDEDLFKFDIYSFAGSTFTRSSATTNISTIKYAAFPADDVKRGYFEEDGSIKLEMSIPGYIVYDEDKEAIVNDVIAYDSNLPMWGTAQADGDGAKADLYHLTGVLAIKVTNMLQNVENLILYSATKDISGTFVATLDAENPESVQLGQGGDDLITANTIIIDLTSVPSQTSVIYVPVLAGVSDLQVWADKTFGDDVTWTGTTSDEKVADFNSTYTFQRNKFKTLTADFGIGSSTPGELTALLDSYKNTLEDELTIDLEKFYVGTTGGSATAPYDGTNVIEVPASDADITVNFKTGMTYGNADALLPLVIQDADPTDTYKGTFTFNVGTLLGTATDITINLPDADVVLAGDFSGSAAKAFKFLAAKSLTIGDGTTVTAIKSDGTTDFVFSDAWAETGVAKLTIAGNATLTTTNEIQFDKYTTEVNVIGKVDGDLGFADNYSLYTLNVTGTTGATPVAAQIDGDVTTIGNVNVALTAEGEAITGTLNLCGAEKTLALTQGYINTINNAVIVYGTWQQPVNTIKLDNTNQGRAAFLTLTDDDGSTFNYNGQTAIASTTEYTKSVWDGNKITVAAYQAFTNYTDNEGNNDASGIFTASQLSTVAVAAASTLYNDIELNNKPWTGNAINANLDGNEKTISNLKLAKNTSTNGLFTTAGKTLTVKDLTIAGVTNELHDATTAAVTTKLGAFVGTNTAKVTAQNVAVTGINIAGNTTINRAFSKIGGFVGDAAADLDLQKVTTAGSIDGYSELGGLVGVVSTAATVDIDKDCASTVTFKQTVESGKTMDVLYAKIGGFIGTFGVTGATLNIKAAAEPAALNHDKQAKEYVSDTSVENGDFYNYVPAQNYIGYCGATQLTNQTMPTFNLKKADGTANKTYVESYFYDGTKKVGNTAYGASELALYTFEKK